MANGREVNLLIEAARQLGLDLSPQGCAQALRTMLGGMGAGCAIHPTVTITSPDKLVLGERVRIEGTVWIDASSERGIVVEADVAIGWGAFLSVGSEEQGHIHLGAGTRVAAHVQVHGHAGVYVGSRAIVAPGVVMVTSEAGFQDPATPIALQERQMAPIRIGDDVSVGAGARVLRGVEIGTGAVIAPGALVDASVPPFAVAAGVPARVIRTRGAAEVPARP